MTKYIRKLVCLLFITFLGISSFSFAYFFFDKEQTLTPSLNNLKIDDIKENYDFGQDASNKQGKTYTIYFFPSAAYMYLYHDYVVNNVAAPEEQFGYKEVTYNSDGSLKTDGNGNVIYKLSENTGKVNYTNHTSSEGSVTYDGAYRRYMGELFSCNNFEADGGAAYGDGTAYTSSQTYLSSNSLPMRTWGIPNDNFTIYPNDTNRVEHYNGRNQYSTDRFGSWGDNYYYGETISDSSDDQAPTGLIQGADTSKPDAMDETNTGRYLPIKLTITNELRSSVLSSVVPYIFTSMGTYYKYRYYHNYTFTEWTYVTNTKNPSSLVDSDYPYSYASNKDQYNANEIGQAFQPKQNDRYFDLLSDLDKYADNNNIIRLYPLFSNGKKVNGYDSSSLTDEEKYTLGGGATEKLKITTSSNSTTTSTSNVEYKYPFFNVDVYNDGKGYFTYGDSNTEETLLPSKYINLFSYNNVKITSSTSELVFSANNIWNAPCGWHTEENDGTALYWQKLYTLDADYINENLINAYGEGLYTFYVIVANYSYQNGPNSSNNNITAMQGTFDTFYNNITSQLTTKFNCLSGKRLVKVTSIDSEMTSYKCSPTVVVFEKIDEPQIITSSTKTFNTSSTRNFYKNVNSLYEGSYDETNDTYSISSDDLSSTSPYTYLVKNVDLTSDTYLAVSINNTSTSTTLVNDDESAYNYDYLICTTSSTSFKDNEVYTKALGDNGYIEVDESLNSTTSTIFKLKDNTSGTSYYGVYDILITFNTTSNKYDIYMYQHDTKMFLYVFNYDLVRDSSSNWIDYSTTYDDATGTYKTASSSVLIFDNDSYLEGTNASKSDVSSKANATHSLDECIRYYISGQIEGTTASYSYEGSELLNYQLIDHVTNEIIGYYEFDESSSTYVFNFNLKINKNHILYLSKVS